MNETPTGMRLQIGVFGRANVGKSSLVNWIAGQQVSIVSPMAGTTTDVVAKAMELLPIGPVTLLDTGGLDDTSALAAQRIERARRIFDRADIVLLVLEADLWSAFEEEIASEAERRALPCLPVVNKTDLRAPSATYLDTLRARFGSVISISTLRADGREEGLCALKEAIASLLQRDTRSAPVLVGDLVPRGRICVLVVPIDLQAPKGRLILPQVQVLRDLLDHGAAGLVTTEREYAALLSKLPEPPSLVVCDSQVVLPVVKNTPPSVPCTTFSILFARFKGHLAELARGARAIDSLRDGDRVLIAEACSHHPMEDDIGRVKIPRWLRQYTGLDLKIDVTSGRDYPMELSEYRLIIHCGACMLTRREMLNRLCRGREGGLAITNYGVAIAYLQGVLDRVLAPFHMNQVSVTPVEKGGESRL